MSAQEIVYAWIRDHAPLTVKMNVTREQSDKLIEAIDDAMKAARNEALEEAAKAAHQAWMDGVPISDDAIRALKS
jgi:soluble cytochrome b562